MPAASQVPNSPGGFGVPTGEDRSRGALNSGGSATSAPGDNQAAGALHQQLLGFLGWAGDRDSRLVHLHSSPARSARHAAWPEWANPQIVEGYRTLGVAQPWEHQVSAADSLRGGSHTVLATGTGSGKSLAAWLPVLSSLADAQEAAGGGTSIAALSARPTALYLAPTKALAADQAAALRRVIDAAGLDVQVATADGDADRAEKLWARGNADVVLTNPDFLHHALLPLHQGWSRLLRGLETVIVDECHTYRGVFGAHVSLVLRRLLRLARMSGARPRVLFASATSADPAVAAARLIGVDPAQVVAVTDDASPRGPQMLALWQPAYAKVPAAGAHPERGVAPARAGGAPGTAGTAGAPTEVMGTPGATGAPGATADAAAADTAAGTATGATVDPTAGGDLAERPRISASAEAAWLSSRFTALGAQSLVFARSRAGVEGIAEHVRDQLSRGGAQELAASVAAYRGGYLPEERRELEAALRRRDLRLLVTTSALELGIDVSGLDAVITAGWPGSRASLQQQAGRAGRAGAPGLAVFVASANPLDQYLLRHPEFVLGEPEATAFDPTNPHVLRPHLCAAAAEAPLTAADLEVFGLPGWELVRDLAAQGLLRERPAGWYWNAALARPAHELTTLRGEMDQLHVVDADTGAVIALIEGGARADSTVHPGALYVHQGRLYGVLELRDDTVVVKARREPGYRTRASSSSAVLPLEVQEPAQRAGLVAATGADGPASFSPTTMDTPAALGAVGAQECTAAPGDKPSSGSATTRKGTATPQGAAPAAAHLMAAKQNYPARKHPASFVDAIAAATHCEWSLGMVEVTGQVTGYDRLSTTEGMVLSHHALDMPVRTLFTQAVWWTMPKPVWEAAGLTWEELPGALHAAEHAQIAMLPLLANCDRWDLGGLSARLHPTTQCATVFVHDALDGGAGFSRHGYLHRRRWVEATLELIENCPCQAGCPLCIQSPKCGNGNEPLSKAGAVRVLRALRASLAA